MHYCSTQPLYFTKAYPTVQSPFQSNPTGRYFGWQIDTMMVAALLTLVVDEAALIDVHPFLTRFRHSPGERYRARRADSVLQNDAMMAAQLLELTFNLWKFSFMVQFSNAEIMVLNMTDCSPRAILPGTTS